MSGFEDIRLKIESFSRRYYAKLLIKGALLFLTFGLLLFLLITGAEFLLWLPKRVRLVLFFGFMTAMLWLGYRYLFVPIGYLLKIRRGITDKEASRLIGKHFPKIGDKLFNLLELAESPKKTDLLLASIARRSQDLKPVPFVEAVSLGESLRYLRYLAIPVIILALIWVSGSIADFFGSYQRVVNFDVAYEAPAPFHFILQNESLRVLEGEGLTVSVSTEGKLIPDAVFVVVSGERMLMQRTNDRRYTLRMEPPITESVFYFSANDVSSRDYRIDVARVPAITDFSMVIDYPKYLGLTERTVTGTGNVTIPEGSKIYWKLEGINTKRIDFIGEDSTATFNRDSNTFTFSRRFYKSDNYQLLTSNDDVNNYERLGYKIDVIKDKSPEIKVEQLLDSLRPNESYYSGGASDDKLLRDISVVYYEEGNFDRAKRLSLLSPNDNVAQFYYTFPSGLDIQEGRVYELYFEAKDNDALRGGKVVKSEVFKSRVYDDKELKDKELDNNKNSIENLNRSLDGLNEQNEELQEINKQQKQENNLEYRDKEGIRQFLKRQKQQEGLMEKFSRELKESLAKREKDDAFNELLQERFERQEMEARKNQELLEELEKVADKIEKDELKKRLEELAKSQSKNKRNLEQLLELTKRYYVTEKAAQLSEKLDALAKKQQLLSELKIGDDFDNKEQENLNKEFKELSKELDELKGDNRALRKPMNLDYNKNQQESIKGDQKDALEEINKHQGDEQSSTTDQKKKAGNRASQKQKSAADKMKQLSEKLRQSMMGASGNSTIAEDAEMLRQVLDNLITFSFKQEGLLESVDGNAIEIETYSTTVRRQKELRELFEHVDDSLFALSLRRAELSEFVNEQITEVYYNIDKSLAGIAENQIYQAASYQQYVLNASNALADFLAEILDNMQQSMMSGQGQGQGGGFQLPDIIKSQGELQEKMEGGSSSSNGGEEGKGEEGQGEKDGDSGKTGEQGEQGEKGRDGQAEGKNGDGRGNGEGEANGQSSGTGSLSEKQLKEIYEIYQEQQTIRNRLEQQLNSIIDNEKRELAKKLVLQMEQFENELLENGITRRTQDRISQIQHQMLKLENAALQQGKKEERESNVNKRIYDGPVLTKPELLAPELRTIEILNRQALPLRPDFQNRVKQYFGNDD